MSLAHKVAESIQAPVNSESKGFNMFEVQRLRADKFVKEGPEPIPDPIENVRKLEVRFLIFDKSACARTLIAAHSNRRPGGMQLRLQPNANAP